MCMQSSSSCLPRPPRLMLWPGPHSAAAQQVAAPVLEGARLRWPAELQAERLVEQEAMMVVGVGVEEGPVLKTHK